jgi:hypothetical protein
MAELRLRGINRIAGFSAAAWFGAEHAAAQGLLCICGEVEIQNGNAAAFRIRPDCTASSLADLDRTYFENAPYASTGEHDDTASYFARYHGRWLHDRQFGQTSGHTLTYTATEGDWMQFRFRGRRVRVTYTAARNRGVAEITLDGALVRVLRQQSRETRWQAEAQIDAGASGTHTLRLRHAGGGEYIDVDRLDVIE